ncbi:MAG: HD-GYP domain-containing protein, partial [Methylophilaceae bacterium]
TDTDSSNDSNNTANSYSITIFEDSVPVEEEMAIIYPVFEKTQIATREIFEAIASENKIDLMQVNQTLDSMVESIERNPDALMWLAKLKQRDDYAYNHALNVSINLMALAHFMALPKAQIKDLGLAGLLQDIGKVKIPTKLLHKEAQLSPAEFIEIKTHVKHGLDILRQTDNMSQNVLNIVANHHERIDGSGYPSKLELKQISLAAQMAGIMDTYCALTSNKPYAKGIFNQHALEQIYASRDKEFSGVLVNQLIQFFGIYPVSSLVELNSGEVAVVIQQNRVRRLQPRVVILLAPDKTKNQYPVTLDLINSPPSPNGEPYKITRGLPPDSYGLNPADFYL